MPVTAASSIAERGAITGRFPRTTSVCEGSTGSDRRGVLAPTIDRRLDRSPLVGIEKEVSRIVIVVLLARVCAVLVFCAVTGGGDRK